MLLSSLFSSRDQDAAHAFLSARNEVQTKVAVLESLEVPALSAHLSVAVLNLSVRGAKQLWLEKRNDLSPTEIDIMLDCPDADLIDTMSLQTGNERLLSSSFEGSSPHRLRHNNDSLCPSERV